MEGTTMWKAGSRLLGSSRGFQSVGRRERLVRGKLGIKSRGMAFACWERMWRKCILRGGPASPIWIAVRNCGRVALRWDSTVRQE